MIVTVYNYFMANIETMIPMVIIMMSALIVFLGILKISLFNRISNKALRCVLLSLTSVALSFASVALTFLVKQYNFDYYWICSGVYTGGVIVVYWLYENTQLRAGIKKIGTYVLNKCFGVIANNINKLADNTDVIDSMFVKPVTKTSKKDELKNL